MVPDMIAHERVAALIGRSNATIVEIGANGGQDTRKLIEPFRYGHLFAFEPDPRAAERFRRTIHDPRVHLFEMAVGSRTGYIDFYQSNGQVPLSEHERESKELPKEWDLSGSIRKPKLHLTVHPWVHFDDTIKVPITTLDYWASENGIGLIDFIWADVQGAEEDLIQGAQGALRRTRWFYTEFSDIELYEGEAGLEEIRRLLPNFKVVEVFENDVLLMSTQIEI